MGIDCAARFCSVWLWCGNVEFRVAMVLLFTVTQWHGAVWGVPYSTI